MKSKISFVLFILFLFISCSIGSSDPDPDPDPDPVPENNMLGGRYSKDLTLKDISDGIDYIVEENIDMKALLTIEPGVTIVFKSNTGIYIRDEGAMNAIGTSEKPIIMRGENSERGYWKGLAFNSTDVRNKMDYVELSDAGSSPVSSTWYGGNAGIVLLNSGNDGGKLTITNTKITNCEGFGFVATKSSVLSKFENISISKCSDAAIQVDANHVRDIEDETELSDNDFDGIEIIPSHLNSSGEHRWAAFDYFLNGDHLIIEKKLTIDKGAQIEFKPSAYMEIKKEGALVAKGTEDKPIIFTGSYRDAPSWKGILIRSSSAENTLSNCIISYGGSGTTSSTWLRGIKSNISMIFDAKLTATNCTISHSGGYGIYVLDKEGTLIEKNNTYENNTQDDVFYKEKQ